MRALVLTKIFPNAVEPLSSPFNRQQFEGLARLCDVQILATIPWFPGAKAFGKWSRAGRLQDVPTNETIAGLRVRHPRFVYLPKIGAGLSGPLYVASLATTVLEYRGKADVVLGSWAYPDGFAAVVLGRLLGIPAVIKLHGSDMNVVAQLPGPRRGLKWAFPRAARVVAVSGPLRDAAIGLGAAAEQVDVVRNGIDRRRFRPMERIAARRALGIAVEGSVIVCVGNVERHKGSLDLVRAFASMPKVTGGDGVALVMVGDGAAKSECEQLAAELGVDVSFVGARPHDEIPQWIAACDVFALPSWNEGMPNVVLEALACGRRVVATRVGGTPDILTSEALGILVPPRDVDALAHGLAAALATSYEPEAVSALLDAPDWSTSAEGLYASLCLAVESQSKKAA